MEGEGKERYGGGGQPRVGEMLLRGWESPVSGEHRFADHLSAAQLLSGAGAEAALLRGRPAPFSIPWHGDQDVPVFPSVICSPAGGESAGLWPSVLHAE